MCGTHYGDGKGACTPLSQEKFAHCDHLQVTEGEGEWVTTKQRPNLLTLKVFGEVIATPNTAAAV